MKKQVQLILVTLFLLLTSLTAFGQTNVGEVFIFEGFRCRITSTTPASFGGVFGVYVDGTVEIIGLAENSKPHGFPGVTITVTVHNNHNDHIYYVNRIADNAFDATGKPGTEKLTSVLIPGNVTSIGEKAFIGNRLTSVTIPNSVESIGSQAFAHNQLESVTIPGGVTHIGEAAFQGNQLTHMTIPGSVTSIGNYAFQGNQLTHVTIPGGVTSIGQDAFWQNKLNEVTIPESVTSLGQRAFGTNDLVEVIIPGGVTNIPKWAFAQNRLREVTIPTGVDSIGEQAFYGSSNLRPGVVTVEANKPPVLHETAFQGGGNRNSIDLVVPGGKKQDYLDNGWTGFKSIITEVGGVNHEFTVDHITYRITGITPNREVTAIGYNTTGGDVTIPDTVKYEDIDYAVTTIGGNAFNGKELTGVTIGENVTHIGREAFMTNQLTSVTFESPSNVTSIGAGAFLGNQLTEVTIPNGVTSIGAGAFLGNQLTEVTIPNGVTRIHNSVFDGNDLTEVTIPEGVTSIGRDAFSRTRINKVIVKADEPPELHANAFQNVGAFLTANRDQIDVVVPRGTKEAYEQAWGTGGTGFKSITEVGEVNHELNEAFTVDHITYRITEITPNREVTAIGYNTTGGDVTIPDTVKYEDIDYAVTAIGDEAFKGKELTGVTIGENVTHIGSGAFWDNELASVTIPGTVTRIELNAFRDNKLGSVVIPGGVTKIGTFAFRSNQLDSVTLGANVDHIDFGAFRFNELTSVIIPSSVTNIGEEALANNPITKVMVQATVPPGIQDRTFTNRDRIDVIVPRGTPAGSNKSTYEAAWTGFASVKEGIEVSIDDVPAQRNDLTPFSVTITFKHNVTGFTQQDIADNLVNATVVDGSFSLVTGSTSAYIVQLEPTVCEGTITIDIPEGVAEYAPDFPNLAASATVTVNANPPTLTLTPGPPVCAGDHAIFTIEGGNKDDVVIYDDGTSTRTITIPAGGKATVPVNGVSSNTTLTLKEVSNENCNISLSEMATVTVNDLPVAPTVSSSPVEYCVDETATALTATGDNLLWYTSEKGGTGEATAPIPGTANAGSTTHYVSQTTNGCESDRAVIEVTVVEACLVQIGDGFTVSGIDYEITSVTPNEVKVMDYIGSATAVEIPAAVDDKGETYAVTAIGANAFSDNPDLSTVKIEADHLLSIHDDAFADRSQVDLVVSIGMRQAYIDAGLTGFASITEEQVVTAIRNYEFKDFTLYPNPATDKVYLDIDPRPGLALKQVNIYTMIGAYLYSENGPVINTSRLPRGTYLFEIVTKKGDRSMRKVIIQ